MLRLYIEGRCPRGFGRRRNVPGRYRSGQVPSSMSVRWRYICLQPVDEAHDSRENSCEKLASVGLGLAYDVLAGGKGPSEPFDRYGMVRDSVQDKQ